MELLSARRMKGPIDQSAGERSGPWSHECSMKVDNERQYNPSLDWVSAPSSWEGRPLAVWSVRHMAPTFLR